jgi:hypothetical protein
MPHAASDDQTTDTEFEEVVESTTRTIKVPLWNFSVNREAAQKCQHFSTAVTHDLALTLLCAFRHSEVRRAGISFVGELKGR